MYEFMRSFFIVLFGLISGGVYCQAPSVGWAKSYGGSAYDGNKFTPNGAVSICQMLDGGSIVTGVTYSSDGQVKGYRGNGDIWVVKLDTKGKIKWQKCFGGSYLDFPKAIKQTSDKGFIIIGSTNSKDGNVSGIHSGQTDAWLVKLDSLGNVMWQKCLGGSAADLGTGVAQTKDSGYYVACISLSTDGDVSGINNNGEDYWIVRLDKNGVIKWQKVFGGKNTDEPTDIQQTYDGGCVVTGLTSSKDGDVTGYLGGPSDCWTIKLDSLGNINWEKCFGGSFVEQGGSVKQTLDSGYVIASSTYSTDDDASGNHGFWDDLIIKMDKNGDKLWSKCYGGSGLDQVQDLELSGSGCVFTAVSTSDDGEVSTNYGGNDYWVVKIDTIGNIIWQTTLGGANTDVPNSVSYQLGKGYLIAGYSNSVTGMVNGNHGDYDFWIIKLNDNAILPVTLLDFTAQKQNNLSLLQWQTTNETNNSYFDIERSFDSKLFYSIGIKQGLNNASANNYSFTDNAPLKGVNYYRLKQVDKDGSFTYSKIVSVNFINPASVFAVSPNPANSSVNIFIPKNNSTSEILLYDIYGKKVLSETIAASIVSKQIYMQRFASGVYNIVLIQDGKKETIKLIKK